MAELSTAARSTTTVRYGLRLRSTGELLRIELSYNGEDSYACGEYSTVLTTDPDCQVFTVASSEALLPVLAQNTPWFNSDLTRPSWGSYKREDLEPVEIATAVVISPVEVTVPPAFRSVEVREVPRQVVRMRLGFVPEGNSYVQIIARLPEGVSRADLPSLVGKHAMFPDMYSTRKIYGVAEVPEEYVDLLEGQDGALLICSEIEMPF